MTDDQKVWVYGIGAAFGITAIVLTAIIAPSVATDMNARCAFFSAFGQDFHKCYERVHPDLFPPPTASPSP